MATMKELLSLMIDRINGKPDNWEELTGKPFGLTMGWEIIVEQPDIIGSGYGQEPYSAFVALTDVTLEQGETYKVTINGDEWQVKAFVLPEDTNVYLGDSSDRLEEMPFHIYSTADSTICIIWRITPEEYEMGAPMANITISKGYDAVDTLGYEFMPLDYPAVLKEYVEIMPKAVIRFEETGLNGSVYSNSTIINEGLLSEDKAYRITFNGEKYICQSQVWRGSAFLGNLEILTGTDGNDMPFAILGNMLNWKVELGDEVSLQIEEVNNVIRPIDRKFIPDGVGGGVRTVNGVAPDAEGNVVIEMPQVPEIEMPELTWDNIEDKPFSKTNQVVFNISPEDLIDLGEDKTSGRYGYEILLNDIGLSIPNIWDNVESPWTFEIDGERFTIVGRRLPMVLSNLSSSVSQLNIFQHGEYVVCDFYFNEPTEHIIVCEAGDMKYSTLEYGYMPDGYPKVTARRIRAHNSSSYTGTLSEDGTIYSAAISGVVLERDTQYQIAVGKNGAGGFYDVYKEIASDDDNGQIIIGSATAPYAEPPFYITYRDGESAVTINWNSSEGDKIFVNIAKIENIITTIDDKFIPDTFAKKEYVDSLLSSAVPSPSVATVGQAIVVKAVDENGKPTEWEAVDAQDDWDVENENSPAYIKNKPFGVKTEMVEIYPETSMLVIPYSITTKFDGELVAGEKYIVKFNGVPCTCTAFTLDEKPENWPDSFEGAVFIGNQIHANEFHFPNPVDTGEDFLFSVLQNGAAAFDINQAYELQSVKLQIFETQEVVTPIDYKFMPEGYPKVEMKMVEIVPEQSVTTDKFGGANINFPVEFLEEKKFKIVINDTEYILDSWITTRGTFGIGDGDLVGWDWTENVGDDVPFCIYIDTVSSIYMFYASTNSSYTITIYTEQEVVTPLDSKYLPESEESAGKIIYWLTPTLRKLEPINEGATLLEGGIITKEELTEMADTGEIRITSNSNMSIGLLYALPLSINTSDDYGTISFLNGDNIENGYTVEYYSSGPS